MTVPVFDCVSREEADLIIEVLLRLHVKCHVVDLTVYTTPKEQFAVAKFLAKHNHELHKMLVASEEALRETYEMYRTGTVTLTELLCLLSGRDSDVITINGVPLQIEDVRLSVGKIDLRTQRMRHTVAYEP